MHNRNYTIAMPALPEISYCAAVPAALSVLLGIFLSEEIRPFK